MTQPMFIKTRQQFSALALSATVTLGMLLSVNMLATQPPTRRWPPRPLHRKPS